MCKRQSGRNELNRTEMASRQQHSSRCRLIFFYHFETVAQVYLFPQKRGQFRRFCQTQYQFFGIVKQNIVLYSVDEFIISGTIETVKIFNNHLTQVRMSSPICLPTLNDAFMNAGYCGTGQCIQK